MSLVCRGAIVNQPLVAATAGAGETDWQIRSAGGATTTALRPPTAADTAATVPLHVGRSGGADYAALRAFTTNPANAVLSRAKRGGDRSFVPHSVAATTEAAAVSPRRRRRVLACF